MARAGFAIGSSMTVPARAERPIFVTESTPPDISDFLDYYSDNHLNTVEYLFGLLYPY